MKTFKQFVKESEDKLAQRRAVSKDRTNLIRDKIKSNVQKAREKTQKQKAQMQATRDRVMSTVVYGNGKNILQRQRKK